MTTVMTVIAPSRKPRVVMIDEIFTDSSDPKCSPSHSTHDYSDILNSVNLSQQVDGISRAIGQGYVGAAEDIALLQAKKTAPAVIWGHFSSLSASGGAAQARRTYAPVVNVEGLAGGRWATNLDINLIDVDGTVSGCLLPSGLPGVRRSGPIFAKLCGAALKPSKKKLVATSNQQCALTNTARCTTTKTHSISRYAVTP